MLLSTRSAEIAFKKIPAPLRNAFGNALPVLLALIVLSVAVPAQAESDKWRAVAEALGKSGNEMAGVYRVGMPRSDLHVTLDGVVLKASLALGSWVAFAPMSDKTMMMG